MDGWRTFRCTKNENDLDEKGLAYDICQKRVFAYIIHT